MVIRFTSSVASLAILNSYGIQSHWSVHAEDVHNFKIKKNNQVVAHNRL